jgi:serine/threonine-protein kinase
MRIRLTVVAGPHEGREFSFVGHDTFLVGRAKHAHFRLPKKDRYFSRVHFLVETNPPQCRLLDMGSRNGTFVNGARVQRSDLQHGDVIKAGRTILRVEVDAEPSVTVPPVPAIAPPEMPALPPQPVPEPPSVGRQTVPVPRLRTELQPAASRREGSAVLHACRVCGVAMNAATQSAGTEGAPGCPGPLCPSCGEAVRMQLQLVPGHWLFRRVGAGRMGVVFQALTPDGDLVAVKTVIPAMTGSQPQIERFLREASILRQLNHPHIVRFRTMGELNGSFYFVMDFIRGTDAEQLLRQQGPLEVPRAVRLACQLLDALAYAHELGYVHRDIKPANLLLTTADGEEKLLLGDFGLARVYQESRMSGLTMTGDWCGTIPFMPPEHITAFRDVQPPADQYAAAATLYNLITNSYVYDMPRELDQQIMTLLTEEPVPIQSRRAEVPRGLAKVIHRALSREPTDRYPDVAALRQALLPFAAQEG